MLPELSENRFKILITEAEDLLKKLFPICRSITGNGVRESLEILLDVCDFCVKDIPSGTKVYDWTIPDEWNIRDAYVANSRDERVIDFRKHNLHLVNYSIPVEKRLSFEELDQHLHTLPNLPNAIPYRTSYYERNWGFCLTHDDYMKLDRSDQYHVVIDSTLEPGYLTYGEEIIKGKSEKEYLISSYCCHPSLANDNLSGMVLWALLLREMQGAELEHNYRFILVPETIGAIAYLATHEDEMTSIDGAYVITTVAGPGDFGYKKSFKGHDIIDRVVKRTFEEENINFKQYEFDAAGSDERQYSSPFFRIPAGTICKDKYYEYKYYHTSLDSLDFISSEDLIKALDLHMKTIQKLEMNFTFVSKNPKCEPMLSKRGLYPKTGGGVFQSVNDEIEPPKREKLSEQDIQAISWLMFLSDGNHSLLDISEKTKIPCNKLYEKARILEEHDLLTQMDTL